MTETEVDPRSIRYEPLKESLIPKILEIEKDSNTAPWSERSFRNELSNPQSIFLVALAGFSPVGFGGLWLCIDEAHITTLAVAPSYRNKGIGRALMTELLKHAQEHAMACSTLEVRASNDAAIHLYGSLGYVETNRRKGYYPDNKEDALVMWLHNLPSWKP